MAAHGMCAFRRIPRLTRRWVFGLYFLESRLGAGREWRATSQHCCISDPGALCGSPRAEPASQPRDNSDRGRQSDRLERPSETLRSLRERGVELTNVEIDALAHTERRFWSISSAARIAERPTRSTGVT